MFWAITSTLSGTCRKEPNCPTNVFERSLRSRKSSRTFRRMRQCLPTFRHGRRPSRHQRHTVVSLTPISKATSSALSSCFSVIVPRLPFLPLSIRPLHHSTHYPMPSLHLSTHSTHLLHFLVDFNLV